MMSLRCHENFDANITLLITNFYHCLIELWWSFSYISINADVVNAQIWEVMTLVQSRLNRNLSQIKTTAGCHVFIKQFIKHLVCNRTKNGNSRIHSSLIVTLCAVRREQLNFFRFEFPPKLHEVKLFCCLTVPLSMSSSQAPPLRKSIPGNSRPGSDSFYACFFSLQRRFWSQRSFSTKRSVAVTGGTW